jgi:hypothetical protein
MANFKFGSNIPEKGTLKAGANDIKRIYKGGTWVWPGEDDSYIPPLEGDFAVITNRKSAPYFGLYDQNANPLTPNHTFGSLPNPYFRVTAASDNYQYMIAQHIEPYSHPDRHLRREMYTTDFGQSWQYVPSKYEIIDNYRKPEYPDYDFLGYRNGFSSIAHPNFPANSYATYKTHISKNGRVMIIPYRCHEWYTSGPDGYDNTYTFAHIFILISNDYGQTWNVDFMRNDLQFPENPTDNFRDIEYYYRANGLGWYVSPVVNMSAGGKNIIVGGRFLSTNFGETWEDVFPKIQDSNPSPYSFYDGPSFSKINDAIMTGNGKHIYISRYKDINSADIMNPVRSTIVSTDYGQSFFQWPRTNSWSNNTETGLHFEGGIEYALQGNSVMDYNGDYFLGNFDLGGSNLIRANIPSPYTSGDKYGYYVYNLGNSLNGDAFSIQLSSYGKHALVSTNSQWHYNSNYLDEDSWQRQSFNQRPELNDTLFGYYSFNGYQKANIVNIT